MKILAFIDSHGSLTALKKIKEKSKNCDIIVCGGDFTIFEQGIKYFLSQLDHLNKKILIVHGNHEESNIVKELCLKHKNLFFLHKNHFIQDDVMFIGFGGGGFSLRDKEFEKQAKKFKELIDKHKDKAVVLVTHAPPYKTRLDTVGREHVGNKSISNFIKENKIDLTICGHLHENSGHIDKIDKSTIINPGPYGKLINI